MKKLFSLLLSLMSACALMAGNVITYTAASKLPEVTGNAGLHTTSFNVYVISHTFSNGTGTITFGGEVTYIGSDAFAGCESMTSITLPNSIRKIGNGAFVGCSGLTSITIPNSVTLIDGYAFYGCSGLTSVTIPNSVTSIGEQAFNGCSGLTSITIPNSVTSIGIFAFSDCSSLTSISIPNSIRKIEDGVFIGCTRLSSITIPNSVTLIGAWAFSDCSGLTSVTIPNSITSIGNSAFEGCSGLTSITIPDGVTSIGNSAFKGCIRLIWVVISSSVREIGNLAFSGCTHITDIYCSATTPPILPTSQSFNDLGQYTTTIHVPEASIELYREYIGWSYFSNIVAWDGTMPDEPDEPGNQDSNLEVTAFWPMLMNDEVVSYNSDKLATDFRNSDFWIWANSYSQNYTVNYLSLSVLAPEGWSRAVFHTTNMAACRSLLARIKTDSSKFYIHFFIKSSDNANHKFVLFDTMGGAPFCIGTSFVDNGVTTTGITNFTRDGNWHEITIPLSLLNWNGVNAGSLTDTNILSLQSGPVAGTELSLKDIYIYQDGIVQTPESALEDLEAVIAPRKIFRNGQIYIQTADGLYTTTGQKVE